MKNWKPILGILLTFIFGTITGGLVVAGVAANRIENFVRNGAQDVAPLVVRRLGRKLDLTAEQKTKLGAIVTHGQAQLREIRRRVEPEVKGTLSNTVDEIRGILTPEQKAKFDKALQQAEKRLGPLKPKI